MTGLKASPLPAIQQPDSDRFVVPSGAKMRAKLLAEDAAYWKVGDATINGEKVAPHINLAYKQHWNAPVDIIPPEVEEQAAVAETPDPEAVPEDLPPEPEVFEAPPPAPQPSQSLWSRLFRKRT
jgi:hypothetical protein